MKTLRYGIIGFGGFAERAIAPALGNSPNSKLVAIHKRLQAAAGEKARTLGVPYAFDSVEKLVEHPDVDAVFIASSNVHHAAHTIAAANAGKHVLVEKPIAMNAAEARLMIDVCQKKSVKLMVGHMARLSPAIQWIKAFVKSGAAGAVKFVKTEYMYDARLSKRQWLFSRATAGGGPLFDIGVHCLDTMRFILDDEIVSVKSQLYPQPTGERTEGTAVLALRFASGIPASIFCGFDAPFRRSILEIIGTEAIISVESFTQPGITARVLVTRGEGGTGKKPVVEDIIVPDLYEKEITLFSECVLENSAVPICAEEGLKNQIVLDEAMNGHR